MIAKAEIDRLFATLAPRTDWVKGTLCARAAAAREELIEREEADLSDIDAQVEGVIDLLESPIEQVAAYHLLARNYAPFTTDRTIHARLYPCLPEEWPKGVVMVVVPQVDIGRYRVDFMVHLRNGAKFAIECDGAAYHGGIRDAVRDTSLGKHFSLLTVRVSGAAIWESPLWTNEVRRTVFMMLGIRDAERMPRHG